MEISAIKLYKHLTWVIFDDKLDILSINKVKIRFDKLINTFELYFINCSSKFTLLNSVAKPMLINSVFLGNETTNRFDEISETETTSIKRRFLCLIKIKYDKLNNLHGLCSENSKIIIEALSVWLNISTPKTTTTNIRLYYTISYSKDFIGWN